MAALLPTGHNVGSVDAAREICEKRRRALDYLKRVHSGSHHWLNVVKLTSADINERVLKSDPVAIEKKVHMWFVLGLSLGHLLELPPGHLLVRACVQLMEEFEFYCDRDPSQQRPRQGPHVAVLARLRGVGLNDPVKYGLRKKPRDGSYFFLQTPPLPRNLDYCKTVVSLCECMSLVYSRLLQEHCRKLHLLAAIQRVDEKFREHAIAPMTKWITELSLPLFEEDVRKITDFVGSAKPGSEHTEPRRFSIFESDLAPLAKKDIATGAEAVHKPWKGHRDLEKSLSVGSADSVEWRQTLSDEEDD